LSQRRARIGWGGGVAAEPPRFEKVGGADLPRGAVLHLAD
jgi:hypothetical protein